MTDAQLELLRGARRLLLSGTFKLASLAWGVWFALGIKECVLLVGFVCLCVKEVLVAAQGVLHKAAALPSFEVG